VEDCALLPLGFDVECELMFAVRLCELRVSYDIERKERATRLKNS
jgi:hypothetical protein